MTNRNLTFRPDIDGLRAVAVLSVFIFHLNHEWLPGGFIGVDIFFVISGYLITRIIKYDLEHDKFNLTLFYQRRIARIFPAFFTVALTTITASAFIYSSLDFASAGANLVAATVSLANIKYMFQGNYFDISPDSQPFLHYWSLSVEEQFYIIFPILLIISHRYARRKTTHIIATLAAISLLACIVLTQKNPVWAFYSLPTRVWELCTGSLLALMPAPNINRHAKLFLNWLPTAGALLIGYAFFIINKETAFPGWHAILPVIGSAAIIFQIKNHNSTCWCEKIIASSPLIAIGKISFSLYLWHWPVFSFVD